MEVLAMAVPDEAEEGYSDKPEVKPEAKRPRPPKEGDEGYAPEPRPRRPAPDSEGPRRKRPRYDDDDDYPDVRRRDDYNDPTSVFIPYKNPKGLAAYYLGVFALIPCAGNVLGPLALIFGILGVRFANANPTARGKGHAIAGIVLGILTILAYWVAPIVFVIAGIIMDKHK
jgi:hypothetical protein